MSRTPYPTDLTDRQWKLIAQHVPDPRPGRRSAKYPRREIVNAVLYQARNGCVWRALPHDLPGDRIVFHYFRAWQKDGTWDRIHDALRAKVRRSAGKTPKPSVPIVDSQTVKGTEHSGPNGYDGGKKVAGRKRFVAVDTPGLLWALMVVPADAQDRAGGPPLMDRLRAAVKRLKAVWGDTHFDTALRHGWVPWAWRCGSWPARSGSRCSRSGGSWSGHSAGSAGPGGCRRSTSGRSRAARRSSRSP